jgi:hypothetical protein
MDNFLNFALFHLVMSTLNVFGFFKPMYLFNTEPLTSLSWYLNAVFHVLGRPMPQDAGTHSLSLLQIFNLFIIFIAVLENVPPDAGLQKRAIFFTLIV